MCVSPFYIVYSNYFTTTASAWPIFNNCFAQSPRTTMEMKVCLRTLELWLTRLSKIKFRNSLAKKGRTQTALELIKRIDSLMESNSWTEQVASHNFRLALKGSVLKWLGSTLREM
jgi:hypothetical protein